MRSLWFLYHVYDCLHAGEGHLYGRGREVGAEQYPVAHLRLHAPIPSFLNLLHVLLSVLGKLGDPAVNIPLYIMPR